jgi:hypothetical protein
MGGLSDDRIAMLAPQTLNVGHPCCHQIFIITDDPDETGRLTDPELTGWRRYSKTQERDIPLGELPERERFFPSLGFERPMSIQALQDRVATLEKNGYEGFIRLVKIVADRFGEEAYGYVEELFSAKGITPEQLRMDEPRVLQGWFWESESGLE